MINLSTRQIRQILFYKKLSITFITSQYSLEKISLSMDYFINTYNMPIIIIIFVIISIMNIIVSSFPLTLDSGHVQYVRIFTVCWHFIPKYEMKYIYTIYICMYIYIYRVKVKENEICSMYAVVKNHCVMYWLVLVDNKTNQYGPSAWRGCLDLESEQIRWNFVEKTWGCV